MLRSVLSTILAAALLTTSAARVGATERGREGNTFEDHVDLVEALDQYYRLSNIVFMCPIDASLIYRLVQTCTTRTDP